MNKKERKVLQEQLEEAENQLEPGNPKKFDFIHTINLLKFWRNLGIGHNLSDRENYKDSVLEMAEELLNE